MAIDLIAQGRFQRTAPVKFLQTFRVTSGRILRTTSVKDEQNQAKKQKRRSYYENKTNRNRIQICH